MDSIIYLGLRIGLLVVLWLFILMVLAALRRDTNKLAGATGASSAAAVRSTAVPAGRGAPRSIMVTEGPLAGSHMPLGTLESVTLGRAAGSDFVLGDDFASASHARLFRRGSQWFIEDMESRNGTFVGGNRIDQPERIGVGTDIKMGRTTVRLEA